VRFTDERKYFVSEASVYWPLRAHDLITSPAYVVIKAANEFKDKATAINQLWQKDFTYLKITGWSRYHLSTVLDDFSRHIVARRLGARMCASDVTVMFDQALAASGLDQITVAQRPWLLSDDGSSYVADDLARWLEGNGSSMCTAPLIIPRPRKVERWHQTLKNTAFCSTTTTLPGDLERQIAAFVEHYNHLRNHESISNLTPADVCFGTAETVLAGRNRPLAASTAGRLNCNPDELEPSCAKSLINLNLSDDRQPGPISTKYRYSLSGDR
jgi:putative transposase